MTAPEVSARLQRNQRSASPASNLRPDSEPGSWSLAGDWLWLPREPGRLRRPSSWVMAAFVRASAGVWISSPLRSVYSCIAATNHA